MAFIRKDPPGSTETMMRGLSDDIPTDIIPTFHALKSSVSKCWDFVATGRPHMPTLLLEFLPDMTTGGPGRDLDSAPSLRSLLHQRLFGSWCRRVRALEVSPDGERLLVRCDDSTASIWAISAVGGLFLLHQTIPKAEQAFWSPSRGNVLLTLPSTGTATIHREHPAKDSPVQFPQSQLKSAVYWMPREQTFASFHQTSVYIMNLKGAIIESHDFACAAIWDITVTNDEQRMILAVQVQQGWKGKDQGWIIVYNLAQRKVEYKVSITDKVQKLTPSRNIGDAMLMLVSYEGSAPPELWLLQIESHNQVRFRFLRTYGPLDGMGLVGPARFGGTQDELVISAEKGESDQAYILQLG
ncbi:hypothetical protein M407DRAFT_215431 [Tulasnella calospora MUT 4182]|uniref:Anaphase-promoting complex subunit 4 WD40 domain-containing protein n=1 Tax=Tulasnella calospora MUT 4182 TaxID=1051891 RepID=A0A0C3QCG2_9AGAM|nr:hypothetical protein M407DRAFT_215431 [Tulasnella calospora MUT 4182]